MRFRNRTLWTCGIAIVFIQCNGETESSSSALDAITKNRRVRISADAVNPPFVFGQATGVQGFDVDTGNEIVKDIAKELGRELDPKWVKAPFETLFKQLQDGNTEMVISCMAITPEREKTFDFSQPYFESALTIARRRDVEDIKTLADLAGKRVGVQASATSQYFLETRPDAANMSILKFKTLDDALGALNRTEIDAVVGDEPILSYSIDTSFPNLITTGEQLVSESYGVMVRKGEEKLLQLVNATLDRLKSSGEFDTWQEKWKIQSTIDKFQQQRAKKEQEKGPERGPKGGHLANREDRRQLSDGPARRLSDSARGQGWFVQVQPYRDGWKPKRYSQISASRPSGCVPAQYAYLRCKESTNRDSRESVQVRALEHEGRTDHRYRCKLGRATPHATP